VELPLEALVALPLEALVALPLDALVALALEALVALALEPPDDDPLEPQAATASAAISPTIMAASLDQPRQCDVCVINPLSSSLSWPTDRRSQSNKH
jgi:hypothetical protein